MEMTEQALCGQCSVCGRVTELLELPGRTGKFCLACSADLATVILLGPRSTLQRWLGGVRPRWSVNLRRLAPGCWAERNLHIRSQMKDGHGCPLSLHFAPKMGRAAAEAAALWVQIYPKPVYQNKHFTSIINVRVSGQLHCGPITD